MSQEDTVFVRTLTGVMVLLGLFFVAIIFLARTVTAEEAADSADRQQAAIAERIRPVGQVSVASTQPAATTTAGAAAAPAAAAPADAKKIYQEACFACHGTGAAGAPKLGDKAAWADRVAQGKDTLYGHAISGFKGMPPRGGRADLDDATVKSIVDYMVAEVK